MTAATAVSVVGGELVLDDPTERLCRAVADGSHAPARLAVVAPGYYGKTALLDRIERDRTRAGLPVRRYRSGVSGDATPPAPPESPALLLVDDAHELTAADFDALRGYLRAEQLGLVLAARPRPRPEGLNELLGVLGGQVLLRPLDLAQTERLLATLGCGQATELAGFVRERTGGVPGLVHALGADYLVESRDIDQVVARNPDTRGLSATSLADISRELDRLPAETMRVLLAAEAGAGSRFDLLAELLDRAPATVAETVESARAIGLLTSDGALLPFGADALRALVPTSRRMMIRTQLAELALAHDQPVLAMIRPWLGSGISGSAVARAFEAAAAEALPADPGLAARMLGAAVDAGREFVDLGARWAELAALAGDFDTALRLADRVVTTGQGAARENGALVAGIALAHRGQPARSVELLSWSPAATAGAFAALVLAGTGRLAEAEHALTDADHSAEPPSLLSGAVRATARGLLESVRGPHTSALSELLNAAEMLEPVGRDVLLADSPAALAALVALHCGEPAAAESTLTRAIDSGVGGFALAGRHRLLLAWSAMLRGDLASASDGLAGVGDKLSPRDWLFAVALEVGIARRASDVAALRRVWGHAREAVLRHPVELLTLLPLGEFAVAAARLGEAERMSPHLRQAHAMLAEIGDPPLWTGLLHWHGLHAAVTAEQHAQARQHAEALHGFTAGLPHLATLATAAECWLDALGGRVDAVRVEFAARGLADAGMRWDGARLAGQAAIRTSDRADMRTLLDCARLLQSSTSPGRPGDRGDSPTPSGPAATGRLSDREREVAELVVAGMTYKEVGARLFISAKTVEHHMARMRQRLGVTNRPDLLAELRTLLGR